MQVEFVSLLFIIIYKNQNNFKDQLEKKQTSH